MKTIAILPVKRFDESLQRLSGEIGSGGRAALAQTMFRDVLVALGRTQELTEIAVVTGDPTARDLAAANQHLLIEDPDDSGQSAAVQLALDQCVPRGFDQALLIPIDCPLLDPADIDRLLKKTATESIDIVIVPDRHGTGTNALLLKPPTAIEPSFGEASLQRHIDIAKTKELKWQVEQIESLSLDVDTLEDLHELESQLEQVHGRAQQTTGVVRQLLRSAEGAKPRTAITATS